MTLPFDENRYQANQQRIIVGRKMLRVPASVQQFFIELLMHTGRRSEYFRTCITCSHWKEHAEFSGKECSLFKVLPPPEVIADGCEHYRDFDEDSIPF